MFCLQHALMLLVGKHEGHLAIRSAQMLPVGGERGQTIQVNFGTFFDNFGSRRVRVVGSRGFMNDCCLTSEQEITSKSRHHVMTTSVSAL